jgi:hypothetical protein
LNCSHSPRAANSQRTPASRAKSKCSKRFGFCENSDEAEFVNHRSWVQIPPSAQTSSTPSSCATYAICVMLPVHIRKRSSSLTSRDGTAVTPAVGVPQSSKSRQFLVLSVNMFLPTANTAELNSIKVGLLNHRLEVESARGHGDNRLSGAEVGPSLRCV